MPAWAMVLLMVAGCGRKESSEPVKGEAANQAEPQVVQPLFPEGDPSVPAEMGGPGFAGEGWNTVEPYPLGDSAAVPGGAITSNIPEWPGNIRMAGTGYNTWLNYLIRDLCYQSLLTLDPNTLEYIPLLATHWRVSDDQMKFEFRINPKAYWSDGKPVTSEDVVASWRMRMDETLLDPSAILVYGKLNEPVAKSKYIVEVTAKDRNWRNFLYFSGMAIFPAHEIGQISGKEYLDQYNYKLTAVSGPYTVLERDIVKPTSITLTRRKDFWADDQKWNDGLYNFEKIRFLVVRDNNLAYEMACKGQLDFFLIQRGEWWAKSLPEVEAVQKGWLVRQKIFNDAPNGVAGFALNMRQAPLDDVLVRKALQHLYAREELIRTLAFGEYTPIDSYWPGSEYSNPANEKVRFDPEEAVALLAEAGWSERGPDGILVKDGARMSLTITYYSEAFEKYLTSYKEACATAGVEINLDRSNPETMWTNMMERKFQMVMISWGGLVFPNPETSFHSSLADKDDNNNLTGFKSARVDELCAQYDLAFTQEERRNIIREIDGIVYETFPYVLAWYQPCQRILYWNKFGMPDYGLWRTSEYENAFSLWWIDPAKENALKAARKDGTSLEVPPLEIHVWDSAE
jgi:microcin C transport system substrate-binding protein